METGPVLDQDGLPPLNRFASGSLSDPNVWQYNWNRTFILEPRGTPVGGVLLLHGLTDSPYSLRSVGLALVARGYRVVGLRLPGHGTAPSGLLTFEVEDLEAATRARDARPAAVARRRASAVHDRLLERRGARRQLRARCARRFRAAAAGRAGADLAGHRHHATCGARSHPYRPVRAAGVRARGLAGDRNRSRSLQVPVLQLERGRGDEAIDQRPRTPHRRACQAGTGARHAVHPGRSYRPSIRRCRRRP